MLKVQTERANYTAVAYIADNSVGDEIGRSVTDNIYLIIICVAVFIVVAILGGWGGGQVPEMPRWPVVLPLPSAGQYRQASVHRPSGLGVT